MGNIKISKSDISEEDYKDLKNLLDELKSQSKYYKEQPMMWTVKSEQLEPCPAGYGVDDYIVCEDGDYTELSSLLNDLHEDHDSCWIEDFNDYVEYCKAKGIKYDGKVSPEDLSFYIEYLESAGCSIIPARKVERNTLNATLFKDDAEAHVEWNGHNLGSNPEPTSFVVHRMPKMQRLLNLLMNINLEEED